MDRLRELQEQHPGCGVEVYDGDFNIKVAQIPRQEVIGLLDQRTFECDWATVERIARYKTSGYKIEIFYFLANRWFNRALAAPQAWFLLIGRQSKPKSSWTGWLCICMI